MMTHFVENFSVSTKEYMPVKNLNETECTVHVKEKNIDTVYKAQAVYTFPISHPGVKNLNGRIYPVALWENVISKRQGEGTFGLMNHPDNDGSVKDIWCVWKNLRLNEDKSTLLCDAYLVGRNGSDVKEMLEAGGKVGLSTSGFGEFTEDNVTLNASSFELERVADFVFNPSAQVYGEQKDIIDKKRESVKEEVMADNLSNTSPLMEKSVRLNLLSVWKEVRTEQDLVKRIEKEKNLLNESNETFTLDIQKEVRESLDADTRAYDDFAQKGMTMESSKADLNEQLVSLKNENDTLKEQLKQSNANIDLMGEKMKKAETLLDTLKVFSSKMKENYKTITAEKNAMIDCGRYKEAIAYGDQCDKQIDSLKERVADAEDKLEESSDLFEEITSLKEENESLKEQISTLKERFNNSILDRKKYRDSLSEIKSLKNRVRFLKKKLETVWVSSDNDNIDVSVKSKKSPDDTEEEDTGDEDYSIEDLDTEVDKTTSVKPRDLDTDTDKEEDEGDEEEEEKPEKEESVKPNIDVRLYYRDLYKKNPSVIKIKEDILKCKNVLDAQRTYSRLHSLIDMDTLDVTPVTKITEQVTTSHDALTHRALDTHKGWA